MNEIKSLTIYSEYFRLINTLKPKKKRDSFLGAICDFYFQDKEPIFIKDSEEEIIWDNLKKPIKKYKTKALNGIKGGRPKTKVETETKTEMQTKKQTETKTEIQSKTKTTSNDVVVIVNVDVNVKELYEYIEVNFGRTLSPLEIEKIDEWLKVFELDVIKYAFDLAVLNGVKTFKYVDGILKNWQGCNFKTLKEIKANEKKLTMDEKILKKFEEVNRKNKEISKEEQEELEKILSKY